MMVQSYEVNKDFISQPCVLTLFLSLGENIDKSKLLSLLAQLRKASNHPYLFEGVEKVAVDGLPTEEIVAGRLNVVFSFHKHVSINMNSSLCGCKARTFVSLIWTFVFISLICTFVFITLPFFPYPFRFYSQRVARCRYWTSY